MNRGRRSRSEGFTLVEVMTALTLLGLLMTALVSSLFALGSGARAGQTLLERVDSERIIAEFLRTRIGSAAPATNTSADGTVAFSGQSDRLEFVGQLPAHRGGGGLKRLLLALDDAGRGNALTLTANQAWRQAITPGVAGESDRYTLLTGIESLRLRYFGAETDGDPPLWTRNWTATERLPVLVEIRIRVAGRSWPPIVAELRTRTAEHQPRLLIDEGDIE